MTESPASEPRFLWGIIISSCFHLALIILLVGMPSWYKPERTYFSSAYRVSLVELPGGKPGSGKGQAGSGDASAKKVAISEIPPAQEKKSPESAKAAKAPPPEPLKKSAPETKAAQKKSSVVAIDGKAEKKNAASAAAQKAKTADAEKAYSRALDKIRDQVGEQQRQEEIARIRERLAGGGEAAGDEAGGGAEAAGGSGDGSGGILPGGGRIANLPLNYRLYYQVIEQKIKSNWNLALPRGILEDMRGLEVVIGITVSADGEITEVSFERKTGNVYLDDSAYRAVKKSSPLPPFADYNIREPFFETGIVFPVGELL